MGMALRVISTAQGGAVIQVKCNAVTSASQGIGPRSHARCRYRMARHAARCLVLCVAAISGLRAAVCLANGRGWELEPYRIRALLAVDAGGGLSDRLATELSNYLRQRVEAAVGPAWSLQVEVASGVDRHAVFKAVSTTGHPAVEVDVAPPCDKLLLLAIRNTPFHCELAAREYDRYVQLWSTPLRHASRQRDELGEQLFALAWQAVRPLARLELIPGDEKSVALLPRGIELSRLAPDAQPIRPGEIMRPVLRRTQRSGELAEEGLQPVPWTYLEVARPGQPSRGETKGDRAQDREATKGDKLFARIHSANRQPLGLRRQGRVEQLAIAVRSDPAASTLRLRTRSDPPQPLVGYDVYLQGSDGASAATLVGTSNSRGQVTVQPANTRVSMLVIKHGSFLLARLPVVPGAEPEVDVPLPDDDARLAAEARLTAVREDLIDLVARRNILMARVRQKIEQDDFSAAQQLIRTLDELPGRPQFQLTLTTAARLLRSDDAQMQRRIDQLFQATEAVVAQYLDARPISQLHDELRAAQREQGDSGPK